MTAPEPSAFQFRVQPEDLIPQRLGGLEEADAIDVMTRFFHDIQDFYALLQEPGTGGGVPPGGGGGGPDLWEQPSGDLHPVTDPTSLFTVHSLQDISLDADDDWEASAGNNFDVTGQFVTATSSAAGYILQNNRRIAHTEYARDDTAAGNVTTGETDLYSFTIPAAMLRHDGDSIDLVASGVVAGHATALVRLRFYVGGSFTLLDTGAVAATSAGSWQFTATLMRKSNTILTCTERFSCTFGAGSYQAMADKTGLDLTATGYVVKITGTASGTGAASNQVDQRMMRADYRPYLY